MPQSDKVSMENSEGVVFDIKRYAIHDGPGIRTTVFLKGCFLRCLWCANPESQCIDPEIYFDTSKCIQCKRCTEVCPEDAIRPDGSIVRVKCTGCAKCAEVCYTDAKRQVGKVMTVDMVLKEILKDRIFYGEDGGVTLSGGEPFFQREFALQLLKSCKREGITTALDTCGHVSYHDLEPLLKYLDYVLYDIKEVDPEEHKALTGVSNKTIIKNLTTIDEHNIPIWIRIPIIPGYTDSSRNIEQIIQLISPLRSIDKVSLIPYHNLGIRKYDMLDRTYDMNVAKPCSKEKLNRLKSLFDHSYFDVTIGG